MKTHVVDPPGGPFHEVDIAIPEPASHEVLVRICASGINPLDTKIRAGQGGPSMELGAFVRLHGLAEAPDEAEERRIE